ncbi:uncharacterized protein G6M90_00g019420 [Metarhizium brunneum]|uniref:Uncharacterized protein n=1 Tax=Metarhizium brunneum TaxID=500148 RepID=A0A7D5UQ25_9HYPO|nr:hypothetical protein G6M90_00g019420 [Metarhizium brunneum]
MAVATRMPIDNRGIRDPPGQPNQVEAARGAGYIRHDADTEESPPNTTDTVFNKQLIVFFTVPPDLFHDPSYGSTMRHLNTEIFSNERIRRQSSSEPWQAEEGYGEVDVFSDAFRDIPSYPLEIWGQTITTCDDLTEIALDSSPEMLNGGVRLVDHDGDSLTGYGESSSMMKTPDIGGIVDPFDGTVGANFVERRSAFERAGWYTRARGSDRMSGTASVDLVEGVNGIARLDVQLR